MRPLAKPPLMVVPFVALLTTVLAVSAQAQDGRYYPLDHRVPGVAGRWSATIKRGIDQYVQPVKIELPGGGQVGFTGGSSEGVLVKSAPAQVGLVVGHTYRLKISDMPEFPDVELYPTVELLDRLHPPEGRAEEFPIPIAITAAEIKTALQDRLVTKVIYLEQPDLAAPKAHEQPTHVTDLSPSTNLIQAADLRGRPMAIVRLGGRIPDRHSPDRQFFGEVAPVMTTRADSQPAR